MVSSNSIEASMLELKDCFEHTNSPLVAKDIEEVIADYGYFISKSDIGSVVQLDTSVGTPDETLDKIDGNERASFRNCHINS